MWNQAGECPVGHFRLEQVLPGGKEANLVLVDKLGDAQVVAALCIGVGVVRVELAELNRYVGLENQPLRRDRVVEVGAVGNHGLRVRLADLAGHLVDELPDVMAGVSRGTNSGSIPWATVGTSAHVRVVVGHDRKEASLRTAVRAGKRLGPAGKVIARDGDHLFPEPCGGQARLHLHLVVQLLHPREALGAEPLGVRVAELLVEIVERVVGIVLLAAPHAIADPIQQTRAGIDPRGLELLALVPLAEGQLFSVDE